MELFVLDNNFKRLYNIDTFESLIWVQRYVGAGEFEFYTPLNEKILEIFYAIIEIKNKDLDCYIWSRELDDYMIIEDMKIQADFEKGYHLIMSGFGLESILKRRIVWRPLTLNSKFQYAINKLLNESLINPTLTERKIPNFRFEEVNDAYIKDLKIAIQYTGVNIYNAVEELCTNVGLGFEVKLDQNNNFVFRLTNGLDRSFEQEDRPYVIFAKNYENLISSDYKEETSNYKNVALVAGEDLNLNENRKNLVLGNASGLKRRELFVDARDLQSEKEDGTKLEESEYNELLETRGIKYLNEHKYVKDMTCRIEAQKTFIYGVDFFVGDMVQVVNDFGLSQRARVISFTMVEDEKGYATYPDFDIDVDKEEEDEE